MRIEKYKGQPYVSLRLDEAYQIKELLYTLSNASDFNEQDDAKKMADDLDEEIMKAEAM